MNKKKTAILINIILIVFFLVLAVIKFKPFFPNIEKGQKETELEKLEKLMERVKEANSETVSYSGLDFTFLGAETASQIQETGFKREDFISDTFLDADGTIIPDPAVGTDILLVCRFRIRNVEGHPVSADCDYILLYFSFTCRQLMDKLIGPCENIAMAPHGPSDMEGKENNRLYLVKESLDENPDRLCLKRGEEMVLAVGFLVNREWLTEDSGASVILIPGELTGNIAVPIVVEESV